MAGETIRPGTKKAARPTVITLEATEVAPAGAPAPGAVQPDTAGGPPTEAAGITATMPGTAEKPASQTSERADTSTSPPADHVPQPRMTEPPSPATATTETGPSQAARDLHDGQAADATKQPAGDEPPAPLAASVAPPVPPPAHRGVGALVAASLAGSVVTAALGAAGVTLGLVSPPPNSDPIVAQRIEVLQESTIRLRDMVMARPASDTQPLEARLAASEAARQALEARLIALEATPRPSPEPGVAPPTDLGPVRAEIERLAGQIGEIRASIPQVPAPPDLRGLETRLETRLQGVVQGALAVPLDRLAQAEGRLQSLTADLRGVTDAAGVVGQRVQAIGALSGAVEAFSPRMAAVESGMGEARDIARRAALAFASDALRNAVRAGKPFSTELEAVRRLGVNAEAIAALAPLAATGLPPAADIAARFSRLAPQIIASLPRAEAGQGLVDQLSASMRSLVTIRPVGEVDGTDPAARVARAEVRVSRGDLSAALRELEPLPEAARAIARPVTALIAARLAAEGAADALAIGSIAALAPAR